MKGVVLIHQILIVAFTLLSFAPNDCYGRIGCFMCHSRNGSNVDCEDPFNATEKSYVEKCKVPKRNRNGSFPAQFCVKLIGESTEYGDKLTIRRCVLENMDTQCGTFKLGEEKLKGCILTCQTDGCNFSGPKIHLNYIFLFIIISLITLNLT